VAKAIGPRLTAALTARASFAGVDWSRTRVFALPSDHHGQLRVNLRGRERDGIVDPADARPLLEEVARGLSTFRDDDGSPTVEAVEFMDDLVGVDAPERDRLPDAIVRWAPRAATPLRWVESPELGRVERVGAGNGRSGAHTGEAWALLVPHRARLREPSRPPRLVDVAATVFALSRVDGPESGGEPLLEPA
jgi:predicted AlkP superfamily phosphohydrolase/phosphomutase